MDATKINTMKTYLRKLFKPITFVKMMAIVLFLSMIPIFSNAQDHPSGCEIDCGTSADTWIERLYLGDSNGIELPADFSCSIRKPG